jgi:gas vesicle protein
MSVTNDPDEIRADIERTRAELSDNVDALADTANPKNIARRQASRVKSAAVGVKEHIMGSSDDPYDSGRVGDAKYAVQDKAADAKYAVQEKAADAKYALQDKASSVGDAVSNAPAQVKQRARGNPLAAGLIAFGAGLLISGLIPSSQREQEAVSTLQEKAEPLKEKATEAAKEVASNLQEPAQQAAQSVKETAAEGVQNVKDEGASAKQDVQGQVQDSAETVRRQRGSS